MRRQLGECRRDRLGVPLALLQPLPFLRQLLLLVRLRRQTGEFLHRMTQPLLIALRRRDRRVGSLQGRDRLTPRAPRRCRGIAQRPRDTERIEQTGMARRIGEADLFVLALHLDQQRRRASQQRHADRLVIDEGARPAILGQHAAQHDLVLGIQSLLGQQRCRGMPRGRREAGGHAGLFGTRTHQSGVRPRPQREAETVQQDRLAGAGLAGEHGQARAERNIQPLDQHNVADGE